MQSLVKTVSLMLCVADAAIFSVSTGGGVNRVLSNSEAAATGVSNMIVTHDGSVARPDSSGSPMRDVKAPSFLDIDADANADADTNVDTYADTDDDAGEGAGEASLLDAGSDTDDDAGEGAGEASLLDADSDAGIDTDDDTGEGAGEASLLEADSEADDNEADDQPAEPSLCTRRRHKGHCHFRRRNAGCETADVATCPDHEAEGWPGCRRRRHGGECQYRRRREALACGTSNCYCQASTNNETAHDAAETCKSRRRHGTCQYRRRHAGCESAPAGTECKDVKSLGCRRRRRHGTCEFRRRRHGETGLIDTKAPESPGCRRRRRNGECNFRRRRLKTDKPSCTGPGVETCLDVDSPCT